MPTSRMQTVLMIGVGFTPWLDHINLLKLNTARLQMATYE